MKDQTTKRSLRSAIYTRVSTEQGLEQDFNSLDAQREAREAYIKSQAHEGWRLVRDRYDDGGFSGGSMVRPALQKLLIDVQARRIDVIVVYKVDRLTRSLADFARLVETFDAYGVSFVSVTQSFNTTTSMGRLTLNVLCPSPSSNGKSPASGSEIRSLLRKRRECGWAAWFPWATGSRIAPCASSRIMQRSCGPSSAAISRRDAWCASNSNSTLRAFGFLSASMAVAARAAAACSAGGMSIDSCRTRSMSAGSPIRARCTKANTRRSCPESCGSKSSEACAITSALRRLKMNRNQQELRAVKIPRHCAIRLR
jgi:hypothetical protein